MVLDMFWLDTSEKGTKLEFHETTISITHIRNTNKSKFSYATMYSFQYHPEAWFYKILSQFLGTAIFAIMTYFILGQSIDWKTGTAILLCFIAVLLQL